MSDLQISGYTITTAHLDRSNIPYIVAGAPRANQNGAVKLYFNGYLTILS